MPDTLSRDYFEAVYQAREDPWNFSASPYEREKYQATLGALDRTSYRRACEIGCSIGVLTAELARRCQELIAIETSQRALTQAQVRCAHLPNIRWLHGDVPRDYPAGPFDLTVVSEVGYYFALRDLEQLARAIAANAAPDGELLLVHWLPPVHDYPLTGDQVHEYFLALPEWRRLAGFRQECYRLDLLARRNSSLRP